MLGVADAEWGNRLVAFVVGSARPRRGPRLGRGGAPALVGAASARASSRRSRCSPTASPTGSGCGRSREGLLDPAAHPLPRPHRPRGRAASRRRRRLGRVEPVPRVRRRGGRAVAPLRRGGGRRGLAGAPARPGAGQRHRAGCRTRPGAPDRGRRAAAAPPRSRWPSRARRCADDEARLEAVRDALGAGAAIRVDANGAWSVDDAVAAIAVLDRAAGGLEYVEQPCAIGRGPGRRTPSGRRADRRGRVDPAGRGPLPGP